MKKHRRSRHSREEWQQLIHTQTKSGLTEAEFCAQRSLSLTRFSHWKRRLEKATPDMANDAHWMELPTIATTAPSGWDIELDLGNGLCLRLHKH
jgi:hypothetical protein